MSDISNIGDFLLARVDEDEAAARSAQPGPWTVDLYDVGNAAGDRVADLRKEGVTGGYGGLLDSDAVHVVRWNPERVLAECRAKRRLIVEHFGPPVEGPAGPYGQTLRLLALPYKDHPDCDPAWVPVER